MMFYSYKIRFIKNNFFLFYKHKLVYSKYLSFLKNLNVKNDKNNLNLLMYTNNNLFPFSKKMYCNQYKIFFLKHQNYLKKKKIYEFELYFEKKLLENGFYF